MSQAGIINVSGGGGGIVTINGDTGSATGSIINLLATPNAGATVAFNASGSTIDLVVTNPLSDAIFIGKNAGLSGNVGGESTGVGYGCFQSIQNAGTLNSGFGYETFVSLTTGSNNTAIGSESLYNLTTGRDNTAVGNQSGYELASGGSFNSFFGTASGGTAHTYSGSYNILIGYQCGNNWTTTESNNIYIGVSMAGVLGESNVMRLGTITSVDGNGIINNTYIAGVFGVSVASAQMVVIDSNGHTGSQAIPTSSQVSFSAYLSSPQSNVTGDGTIYTVPFDTALTNIGGGFDTGTGVFTAPITGNYQFNYIITYFNTGASTSFIEAFQGTNFNVRSNESATANVVTGTLITTGSMIFPMTAGDTMFITAAAFGSTKTVEVYGAAPTSYATTSMFSGFLI